MTIVSNFLPFRKFLGMSSLGSEFRTFSALPLISLSRVTPSTNSDSGDWSRNEKGLLANFFETLRNYYWLTFKYVFCGHKTQSVARRSHMPRFRG